MGTSEGPSSERPERPSSWPAERPTGESRALLSDWPEATAERLAASVPSVPPEFLAEEVEQAPWDQWYSRALDEGIDGELAELGRRVMREASVQRWPARLRRECGFEDGGEAMIELASDEPDTAEARWRRLLSR